MSVPRYGLIAFLSFGVAFDQTSFATEREADVITIVEADGDLVVRRGDALIAVHVADSGGKPILDRLRSPSGLRLTRDHPMRPGRADESTDHPHHRGLWLTHGEVNGIDFWTEDPAAHGDLRDGDIIETSRRVDGDEVTTDNVWRGPDGDVLREHRTLRYSVDDGRTVIDWTSRLTAGETPVRFGDTKEGTLGVRVAGTMKVDAGRGGTSVNAAGDRDGDAWGEASPWCDYSGPTADESDNRDGVAGITIHSHPSNVDHPPRWHTRTYGLFAANPFGVHHFTGGARTDGVGLPPGETLTLRYRIVLHDGGLDVDRARRDQRRFEGTGTD